MRPKSQGAYFLIYFLPCSKFMAMKFLLPTLLFSASVFAQTRQSGNLTFENIPESPAALLENVNQYLNTRSASLVDIDPSNGQVLISTRFGETAQLHLVAQPGATRNQLTFFREPVSNAVYSPDKTSPGFLFLKDEGGNEFSQIFWFDQLSGKTRMITEGARSQNGLPIFSKSGKFFLYTSTRRNSKDYDIWIGNLTTQPNTKLLLERSGSWGIADISPDETKVLLRHYVSVNKSELFLYDIAKASAEQLFESTEEISYGSAKFSADSKSIYYCSDEGSDFQVLKIYNLNTKQKRAITHSMRWDVGGLTGNNTGSKLIFIANENGTDKMYLLNTAANTYTPLDAAPHGVISATKFHPDGKTIVFSVSTPTSSGDVYSINTDSKLLQRWTFSETGGLNAALFPPAEEIEYTTFDEVQGVKRKIPALLYRPKNSSKKTPVLIQIHGGPEGQSRPQFSSMIAYLVNELGIAVLVPNVRGSTGYGKNYMKLDNGMLRENSVKDIGALIDWVKSQASFDTSRVAVMGGSYGGYMTLASMCMYNSKLRCGIDVVGISNFVSFLQNTEDYRKDLRRVEYGDERVPEMKKFLENISPLNKVQNITKPMLIVQGANDPRVPKSEAEQMKTKLQAQGTPTWYLLASDEGHGFKKKSNVDAYNCAVILFLKQYLLGD